MSVQEFTVGYPDIEVQLTGSDGNALAIFVPKGGQ